MPQLIPQKEFLEVGIKLEVTENHEKALKGIRENTVTFITGPAGTGKTHIALAEGIRSLLSRIKNKTGKTRTIKFIRTAVEAQENIGFLPGDLDEKVDPYMEVFHTMVDNILGEDGTNIDDCLETHSLAFLRSKTFENCYVVVDEAQNLNPAQMKLVLSRIGKGCKMIICGDVKQTDIKGYSGLSDAEKRLYDVPGIAFCKLTLDDNMRNGIVRKILERYEE